MSEHNISTPEVNSVPSSTTTTHTRYQVEMFVYIVFFILKWYFPRLLRRYIQPIQDKIHHFLHNNKQLVNRIKYISIIIGILWLSIIVANDTQRQLMTQTIQSKIPFYPYLSILFSKLFKFFDYLSSLLIFLFHQYFGLLVFAGQIVYFAKEHNIDNQTTLFQYYSNQFLRIIQIHPFLTLFLVASSIQVLKFMYNLHIKIAEEERRSVEELLKQTMNVKQAPKPNYFNEKLLLDDTNKNNNNNNNKKYNTF